MRKEANFLSLCSCKVCLFRNLRTVLDGYYCAKGRVAGNFICPGLTVFQSITSVTFHPLNGELTLERLCFFVFFLLWGSFSWLILTRNILKGKLIILTQHLKIHFFHKVLSNAFPLEMTVKMQFVFPERLLCSGMRVKIRPLELIRQKVQCPATVDNRQLHRNDWKGRQLEETFLLGITNRIGRKNQPHLVFQILTECECS